MQIGFAETFKSSVIHVISRVNPFPIGLALLILAINIKGNGVHHVIAEFRTNKFENRSCPTVGNPNIKFRIDSNTSWKSKNAVLLCFLVYHTERKQGFFVSVVNVDSSRMDVDVIQKAG